MSPLNRGTAWFWTRLEQILCSISACVSAKEAVPPWRCRLSGLPAVSIRRWRHSTAPAYPKEEPDEALRPASRRNAAVRPVLRATGPRTHAGGSQGDAGALRGTAVGHRRVVARSPLRGFRVGTCGRLPDRRRLSRTRFRRLGRQGNGGTLASGARSAAAFLGRPGRCAAARRRAMERDARTRAFVHDGADGPCGDGRREELVARHPCRRDAGLARTLSVDPARRGLEHCPATGGHD